MDSSTRHRFAAQLAVWAQTLISHGRTPFRKVECAPTLITSAGFDSPPLVFWINRPSLMAGGLLIFPEGEPAASLAAGARAAEALGLKHFLSWSSSAIEVWECAPDGPRQTDSWPAPDAIGNTLAPYQDALSRVLDTLKRLCVIGALPPEQLPPAYFANLLAHAWQDIAPHLSEAHRRARGAGLLGEVGLDLDQAARQQGLACLLRLLALQLLDRLPPGVAPEQLESQLEQALADLPPAWGALRHPLAAAVPLPGEAAVTLLHLLYRLTQLQWQRDPARVAAALRLWLNALQQTGVLPRNTGLSAATDATEAPHLTWRLVPPPGAAAACWEVAPPDLLAMSALLRHLEDSPTPAGTATSVLQLPAELTGFARLAGIVPEPEGPANPHRREDEVQLRRVWPNRRFQLPRSTSASAFQLLTLLGLAKDGASVELQLSTAWLDAPALPVLLGLMQSQFSLQELALDAAGHWQLRLNRGECASSGQLPGIESGLSQSRWQQLQLSELRLLLRAPAPLAALVARGDLLVPPPAPLPADAERGLALFCRAQLGQLIWRLAGAGDPPLPTRADSLDRAEGVPLPRVEILRQLAASLPTDAAPPHIDRELQTWFKLVEAPLETWLAAIQQPAAGRKPALPASSDGPSSEDIRHILLQQGIPKFPDQYLYALERPALRVYQFRAPLQLGEQFFQSVQLIDADGQQLEVDGFETARALQLISQTRSGPVSLPSDAQDTAAILARYLSDLEQLRQRLLQETHLVHRQRSRARALARRIWNDLQLPPWSLLER